MQYPSLSTKASPVHLAVAFTRLPLTGLAEPTTKYVFPAPASGAPMKTSRNPSPVKSPVARDAPDRLPAASPVHLAVAFTRLPLTGLAEPTTKYVFPAPASGAPMKTSRNPSPVKSPVARDAPDRLPAASPVHLAVAFTRLPLTGLAEPTTKYVFPAPASGAPMKTSRNPSPVKSPVARDAPDRLPAASPVHLAVAFTRLPLTGLAEPTTKYVFPAPASGAPMKTSRNPSPVKSPVARDAPDRLPAASPVHLAVAFTRLPLTGLAEPTTKYVFPAPASGAPMKTSMNPSPVKSPVARDAPDRLPAASPVHLAVAFARLPPTGLSDPCMR